MILADADSMVSMFFLVWIIVKVFKLIFLRRND